MALPSLTALPTLEQPLVDSGRALTPIWRNYLYGLDRQVSNSAKTVLFDSRAAAIAATVSGNVVMTAGYAALGDGGGGTYLRVANQPSHAGKFQDASGAWFELTVDVANQYQFGAKGDFNFTTNTGTDDTTALQNWINYCATKNVPGYGKAGAHAVPTATLEVPSGFLASGEGDAFIIVRNVNTNAILLHAGIAFGVHAGTGAIGVEISRWTFQYTASATTASSVHTAVFLNRCTRCQVTDCRVLGPFYLGIEVDDGTDCKVERNYISGIINRALYLGSPTASYNVHFIDNTVDGAARYTISSPDVGGSTTPGSTTGVTINVGQNLTTYGININAFGTGIGTNLLIEGNDIRNCRFDGIVLGDRNFGAIVDNEIFNIVGASGSNGISVEAANVGNPVGGSPNDIVVANNRIKIVGATGSGSSGIIALVNSNFVTIDGNTILQPSGQGIFVSGSQFVAVTGNIVRASGGIGIAAEVNGANAAQRVQITGNQVISSVGDGILLNNCLGFGVDNNQVTSSGGNGISFVGACQTGTAHGNKVSSNTGVGIADSGTTNAVWMGNVSLNNTGGKYVHGVGVLFDDTNI